MILNRKRKMPHRETSVGARRRAVERLSRIGAGDLKGNEYGRTGDPVTDPELDGVL